MKSLAHDHKIEKNTLLNEWAVYSTKQNMFQKIIHNALTTCFALLPESIDPALKQQRGEHISVRMLDKDYLTQASKELLQWVYEHIHFLWWPIPKGIELYRQQWTLSKTACPPLQSMTILTFLSRMNWHHQMMICIYNGVQTALNWTCTNWGIE